MPESSERSARPDAEGAAAAASLTPLAFAVAETGIWEYDVGADRLVWDDRVREVAEVDEDFEATWEGGFLPCVHPEDRAAVHKAFEGLLAGGAQDRVALQCRIIGQRTGRETWAAIGGRRRDDGGTLRVVGTARDVTGERRAAEEVLRVRKDLERRVAEAVAERQIWADMFEGSEDPIAAVDSDLRLIALNGAYRSACERLFGVTLQVGAVLPDALAHMADVRDVTIHLWRRALNGEILNIPRSQERGGDGNWHELCLRPLHDRDGKLIGAYQHSRNVTARVQAQERLKEAQRALVRAQKMEAMGQLTGGVAHDFNNLLQVIGGNLQLLMDDVAGNDRGEQRVRSALAGVTRGARLAAQLLAFGRRQPLEPKVIDPGRFIRGLDDLLRKALGAEIALETVISGGLWNVEVDPSQLENAILNLAINARDAMAGHGSLTLEAGNAFLDDAYCRAHEDLKPGQYVMIAVTDTGSGISPEIIERVFEPFFSTKPEGQGGGLGLSMVYGLVKQSGGHAKAYSEVGEGTTIRLYLPRVLAPEDVVSFAVPGPVTGGQETILVVEDDDAVRDTVTSLLRGLGYEVLEARDASAAFARIRAGVTVDLLFTDVVMPGPMRSPELAKSAREHIPGLAVLFTSGYTENAIVHGGRLDPGVDLLSKPYTREALALKVRQALDARPPVAPAPAPAIASAPAMAPERAPTPRKPTILLVEDDGLVRFSTLAMLEDLGHEVVEAPDAETALQSLEAGGVEILITDRGLPGISGDELARTARRRFPEMGIVFATGAAHGDTKGVVPGAVILVKPYSIVDLERAVARAASGGGERPET